MSLCITWRIKWQTTISAAPASAISDQVGDPPCLCCGRHEWWYPKFHQPGATSLHQFTVFGRKNTIQYSLFCHCPRSFPGLPAPVHLVSADIMTFTAMTPDDAVLYVLICFPNVGQPKDPLIVPFRSRPQFNCAFPGWSPLFLRSLSS